MGKLPIESFTSHFEDKSTVMGFAFKFYCDLSDDFFETDPVQSVTGKRAARAGLLRRGIDLATTVLDMLPAENPIDATEVGEKAENLVVEFSKRLGRESLAWQRERAAAFENALAEAHEQFKHCPACEKWVCPECWDRAKGVCVEDAKGSRVCPACGKLSSSTRFCTNCGSALELTCSKCGGRSPAGTAFCGRCGMKLGAGQPSRRTRKGPAGRGRPKRRSGLR